MRGTSSLGERLVAERIMDMILKKDTPDSDIDKLIWIRDIIEYPDEIGFKHMKFLEQFGYAIFDNPKGVCRELVKMLSERIQKENSTFNTYKMCFVLYSLGKKIQVKKDSKNKNNIIFSRELIRNYSEPVYAISLLKLLDE